jgi:polar amino acid transport system substrate-binding protein
MVLPVLHAQQTITLSATKGSVGDEFIFNQILKEAYKRIGITVNVEFLPNERALMHSNEGVTDGETARVLAITNKFPNLVVVPVPVMRVNIVAYTTKNEVIPISGWGSLKPYKIVFIRGSKILQINAENFQWDYHEANTSIQMFNMLLLNRAEIAVASTFRGTSALATLKNEGHPIEQIRTLDPPLSEVLLYHFLHKKNQHLVPKITASLKEMEKGGTLKKKLVGFSIQHLLRE